MNELISTFGLNWKLLLMQAVNFGILLYVLKRVLFKPVMAMLDERKRVIARGVKDAEDAARKNAEAEAAGKLLLADAEREGDSIIAKAKLGAEQKGTGIIQQAEARAASIAHDADLRAQETKERALKESREEIAKAAILVAEKLLRGEGKKA
jgi:F-type H+-transporting ATPase subunit b